MNDKSGDSAEEMEADSLPTALVGPSRLAQAADLTGTYMWVVALICLLIAIGLVAWTLPERGINIDIHFPEGHGLESEDAVRFRGIDVGIVEEVQLNADLTGVDVRVNLKPFAQELAREGTRFWIVRPELSLAGISGLDTAVGHKYIGLLPGEPDAVFQRSFQGLAVSPPDAFAVGGMEIIIRGDRKHSVSTGAPVTCRGVEIGRILSVGLSQDGRFADVRARIFEKYTSLVTTKSKFWATSGVDFDFSLGDGIKLDMESLETIARGGVSMLTIENGGQPVKPGQVFSMYSKPEDGWYQAASLVSTTDVKLRGVLPLEAHWQQRGLLGESTKQTTFNGIPFRGRSGESSLLVPSDMLRLPTKGVAGSLGIAPLGLAGQPLTISETQEPSTADEQENGQRIAKLSVPGNFSSNWLNDQATRTPEQVEDCLAVRASGDSRNLTYLHYPIEKLDITVAADGWELNSFNGDRDVWHGSPVLAASDGKLIGVLLIGRRQSIIATFNPKMLDP
jgi:paraquat-inducible protein B